MTIEVDERLRSKYEAYYGDASLAEKRKITAAMTMAHLTALTGSRSGETLDSPDWTQAVARVGTDSFHIFGDGTL